MPALAGYRKLLAATGPGFLLLAFFARLPAAMGVLGALTLVASTTDSFASAGIAAGAVGLGSALGGPMVGALADRFGQRLVGVTAALADALAYAALLFAALGHAPLPVVAVLAFFAGFASPQVPPLVRVRWAALLGDRGEARLLPTAMSYEGAADELSFILGPALVGALALTGLPAVPLLGAVALLLVCATGFALHPSAPPVVRLPRGTARERLPVLDLVGLVGAMALIGVVFGATQTGITALAESVGRPGAGGLVYALMGIGSVIAGVLTAALPARFALSLRYVVFAGALLVGTVGLLFVGGIGGAMLALAVLGIAVAPYLITVYALAEAIAPPSRAGTAMTFVASGIVAGIAAGAALAGQLADSGGYASAFMVPIFAGALALVLSAVSLRRLGRLRRYTAPPATVAARSAQTPVGAEV